MLIENDYLRGVELNESLKYNIAYEKEPLFNIVCSGLVSRLLSHEYASNLTEEQRLKLE